MQDFFREIERHWSWRRQKQIILSPVEFEEMERWRDQDVPLPVVLRAIDVFIKRKEKAKRQRSYLLTHVRGDVAKVLREHQSLRQGQDGGETNLLAAKMDALIRKLNKLVKAFPERATAVRGIVADLESIDLEQVVSYEDIEGRLAEREGELIEGFREALDPDDLAAIREEISELVTEEEDPEFFRKMLSDSVRVHFGLPRLTLLAP